jgi:hypothetical protein
MDPKRLRKNLVELLEGGHAHITMDSTTLKLPRKYRIVRPPGMHHSAWELLEHMRLAQEDILRYTLDPNWESPPFPEGYCPENPSNIPDNKWNYLVTVTTTALTNFSVMRFLGSRNENSRTAWSSSQRLVDRSYLVCP